MIKISDDNPIFPNEYRDFQFIIFLKFHIHAQVWVKNCGISYFYTDKIILNILDINS